MSAVETKLFQQTLAFVGNPNSGKTTLYNKLTASHQKTGNFCGVTVDWVSAECSLESKKIQLIDLPGVYTLAYVPSKENIGGNEDELVTRRFLDEKRLDVIVNVVDASHLERNLYLTLQCLELGIPTIVVLTRIDLAQKKNIHLNVSHLQKILGCPVIGVSAKTGIGIEELKTLLFARTEPPKFDFKYPAVVEEQIDYVIGRTDGQLSRADAVRCLEGDVTTIDGRIATQALKSEIQNVARELELDIHMATARYRFIETKLLPATNTPKSQASVIKQSTTMTQMIDKVACHKWLGLPFFLGVMYFLFFFAINVGGAFQDCIEQLTELVFVTGVGDLLRFFSFPEWIVLFFQGIGQGVSTVLTFVPVIGAMFFALAFLESSGYMSRAAIVMDRLMLMLGLPGKSFVPMIVGFGCNVPAILGARTLDSHRDRILAVMMSPFMSCGARLAIFTVFVSIFFPHNGQNVVFALYLIGIFMAVFTGLLLKKTILNGSISPLIMEMPEYTLPTLRTLMRLSHHRLKRFIGNATKLIVPVCIVIGMLNSIYISASDSEPPQTLLAIVAKKITPIFSPMGITENNWPATVGLFTGVLAKEVVIGSLNSLYAQPMDSVEEEKATEYGLAFSEALMTVPENLLTLRGALSNPIAAQAQVEKLEKRTHEEIQTRFGSAEAAFAYLLFILLYFPCVSATAAMVREVNRGWTLFSVFWTTGLAYCIAVSYYQLSTWALHPMSSAFWGAVMGGVLAVTVGGIHWIGAQQRKRSSRALPTQIVFKH